MLHISGHQVTTVPAAGIAGIAGIAGLSNGNLLRAIKDEFDVFVTIDGNLEYQANPRRSVVAGDRTLSSEQPPR